MDPDAAFDTFRRCTAEVLQVPPDRVRPEARLGDDLDADSLDLIELVMSLEEAFGIEVPEGDLDGVETVAQAFRLVAARL